MPRPTREQSAAAGPTRQRILVAASVLFARRGYHGTSTRAIAEAVGIRQPSMFHHFPSKSDVMKELLDISLTPTRELSRRMVESEGSPAVRIARFLLELVTSILTSRFNLIGLYDDDVLTEEDFTQWRRFAEEQRADQRRLIEQGMASGEFLDVDVRTAQVAVEGLVLGVIRLHRGSPPADLGSTADRVVLLALRMLLRDPEHASQVLAAARAPGPPSGKLPPSR